VSPDLRQCANGRVFRAKRCGTVRRRSSVAGKADPAAGASALFIAQLADDALIGRIGEAVTLRARHGAAAKPARAFRQVIEKKWCRRSGLN